MRTLLSALCLLVVACSAAAFVAPVSLSQSTFAARAHARQQAPLAAATAAPAPHQGVRGLHMGKMSKFGIFSPAVIGAKVVLGEARLNKIRGKVIALHSQTITSFCDWVGADSKMRGLLIKKAKTTGDELGFLW